MEQSSMHLLGTVLSGQSVAAVCIYTPILQRQSHFYLSTVLMVASTHCIVGRTVQCSEKERENSAGSWTMIGD